MAKINSAKLFPILNQPTGIARMVANAKHADDGHLVEFKMLEVRSILNKSVSKRRLSLAYSINPYRGCEFGCKYCYARYTHEFMEKRDPEQFEREIYIKQHAAWLLRQERCSSWASIAVTASMSSCVMHAAIPLTTATCRRSPAACAWARESVKGSRWARSGSRASQLDRICISKYA